MVYLNTGFCVVTLANTLHWQIASIHTFERHAKLYLSLSRKRRKVHAKSKMPREKKKSCKCLLRHFPFRKRNENRIRRWRNAYNVLNLIFCSRLITLLAVLSRPSSLLSCQCCKFTVCICVTKQSTLMSNHADIVCFVFGLCHSVSMPLQHLTARIASTSRYIHPLFSLLLCRFLSFNIILLNFNAWNMLACASAPNEWVKKRVS